MLTGSTAATTIPSVLVRLDNGCDTNALAADATALAVDADDGLPSGIVTIASTRKLEPPTRSSTKQLGSWQPNETCSRNESADCSLVPNDDTSMASVSVTFTLVATTSTTDSPTPNGDHGGDRFGSNGGSGDGDAYGVGDE
jgi:hypothetical protein